MSRADRSLRTRLLLAFIAVSVGVLAISGVTAYGLARRTAAASAESDLRRKAPDAAAAVEQLGRRLVNVDNQSGRGSNLRSLVGQLLRVATASLVRVTPDGHVIQGLDALAPNLRATPSERDAALLDLPAGVTANDLDTGVLSAGQQHSGQVGDLVFVAQPLQSKARQTARGRLVLVLTQKIDTRPLGRLGPYLLLSGGVALLLAVLFSFYLARRLTRPMAAMQATAGRIAAGDLGARVVVERDAGGELSALAATLNSMAAQLEQAQGLERAFLMSVSHDLRTPLTSIQGYAEAIADGTVVSDDERVRAARIIGSEAQRLTRLVADLLDLARLDAHEFSLRPRPVDVAGVVRAAAEAFGPAAGELGVALAIHAPGPVIAEADPERLGQIVANLTENALKYASARIDVRVGVTDESVEVRIDDDGPGIDPVDLPHVFDRLYTSRTSTGRNVGTGLGLAIVRQLTEAMHGTARVEQLAGGGTRFTLHRPT